MRQTAYRHAKALETVEHHLKPFRQRSSGTRHTGLGRARPATAIHRAQSRQAGTSGLTAWQGQGALPRPPGAYVIVSSCSLSRTRPPSARSSAGSRACKPASSPTPDRSPRWKTPSRGGRGCLGVQALGRAAQPRQQVEHHLRPGLRGHAVFTFWSQRSAAIMSHDLRRRGRQRPRLATGPGGAG
jgi:hypothetical protein